MFTRFNRLGRPILAIAVALPSLATFVSPPAANAVGPAIYTVSNVNDAGPGSLRQAILDANAHRNDGDVDQITFRIPTTACGPSGRLCSIKLKSPLPAITEGVSIDGHSQGRYGALGAPMVELDGSAIRNDVANGLVVSGGASTRINGLIIGGFSGAGVSVRAPADGASIIESYIGVDQTATSKRPNLLAGVEISTTHAALFDNIIGGNGVGILFNNSAGDSVVSGNAIGTNRNGTVPLGNQSDGIQIVKGSNILIGEQSPDSLGIPRSNRIAHNGVNGVSMLSGEKDAIYGNLIHDNGGLAIDLGRDGPTPNDPGDQDTGPNGRLNFPTIASARGGAAGTMVTIALDEPLQPGDTFTVYRDKNCGTTGRSQAREVFAQASAPRTPGNSSTLVIPGPLLPIGTGLTALRTHFYGPNSGVTSELSPCRPVAQPGIDVKPGGSLVTAESGTALSVTVSLTERPLAAVTIPLSSSNTNEGTVSPSSLTFTPENWGTAQQFTVTGVDDKVADTDASYKVVIGPAGSTDSGFAGLDPADLDIVNKANGVVPPVDTTPPTLTVASVEVREGTDVKTNVALVFTLSAPSTDPVSVSFATSDDSAVDPEDYAGGEGVVTFKPGATKATVKIMVVGDAEPEKDETFIVKLFDAKGATLAQDFATVTIVNDD